jgi:murein DD-endopeptidase MepM/ murein hydrolase activator NlpD
MKKNQKYFVFVALFIFSLVILPMSSWHISGAPKDSVVNLESDQTDNNDSEIIFTSPVKTGKISSQFGMRMHPIYRKEMHHNGIDIASNIGTEIYSSADGTIEKVGVEGKFGKRILIRHTGGYQTLYAQLGEIFVEENQKIKKGDLIALIGESEFSTGPHLHFEIRLDGKPRNPEIKIDFSILEMPD